MMHGIKPFYCMLLGFGCLAFHAWELRQERKESFATWRADHDAMLMLTRRIGETLRIGDEVVVTVLGIHGSQVRIGIEAPKCVAIVREEVLLRDQQGSRSGTGDDDGPPAAKGRKP